jgi:uncharacterized membrane protein YfcA
VKRFWDLLEKSVILQATITLVFAGTVVYLIVVNRPVPEIIGYALSSILGFYFGSKSQQQIDANSRAKGR